MNGCDNAATIKRVSKAVDKSIKQNMYCGAINDVSTCAWGYKKTKKFFAGSARPLKVVRDAAATAAAAAACTARVV